MPQNLDFKKEAFLKRFCQIFNVSHDNALIALSCKRKKVIRFPHNVGLDSVHTSKPIAWCPRSYYLDKEIPGGEGRYILQNASSLLPPIILDPKPGETLLDLCAAPGIKTTQLYDLCLGNCQITANDAEYRRVLQMKKVFVEFKMTDISQTVIPAQYYDKYHTQGYDKILVDAPCSGEGMIDISPKPSKESREVLKRWNLKRIESMSKLQKKILATACRLLKPGGSIVYSTCTYAPEENEFVINNILKKFPNIQLAEINLKLFSNDVNLKYSLKRGITHWNDKTMSVDVSKCLRIFPSQYFEGFFVAKLSSQAI